uniref:Uncharacterized protein n=1 Tax=Opuntia streptacantha TaxID=393608 RepID=A0A7C8YU71_OPUST
MIGNFDNVTLPIATLGATESSLITGFTCVTFSGITLSPSTFAITSKCIFTFSGFVLHSGNSSRLNPSPFCSFFSTPKPIFKNVWADTSAFKSLKEPLLVALGPKTVERSISRPSKFGLVPFKEATGHNVVR